MFCGVCPVRDKVKKACSLNYSLAVFFSRILPTISILWVTYFLLLLCLFPVQFLKSLIKCFLSVTRDVHDLRQYSLQTFRKTFTLYTAIQSG